MNDLNRIVAGKSPTLFLDRDGVINRRLPGEYVTNWQEFEWLPGVPEAIAQLNQLFSKTIIVTNQQGIGKGLMSEAALTDIHTNLQTDLARVGGKIDLILHCPDLRSQVPNCRKPGPAMALKAQQQFPQISFEHALMVGDSISDLQFGKHLGMATVLITTNPEEVEKLDILEAGQTDRLADFRCSGLMELVNLLRKVSID